MPIATTLSNLFWGCLQVVHTPFFQNHGSVKNGSVSLAGVLPFKYIQPFSTVFHDYGRERVFLHLNPSLEGLKDIIHGKSSRHSTAGAAVLKAGQSFTECLVGTILNDDK